MADEDISLRLDLADSAAKAKQLDTALEGVEKSATRAAAAGDKLEQATEKVGKSSANSAMAMLQLGRGVQDFQAAGLNGIVNNFEGLALALGLGSGVAGVATLAAVAAQSLMPQIKALIGSLGDGDRTAAGMAAALDKIKEAGDKLKAQLAELHAAAEPRLKQMIAENDQLERRVKLEEARAAAAKRADRQEAEEQARAAAMEGAPGRDEMIRQPSEKARAEDLRKLIGGNPEASLIKSRVGLAIQNDPRFRVANQEARDAERDRILGAFYAGHVDALNYVIRALRPAEGTPEGFMPEPGEAPLRGQLEHLTPAAQLAQRAADIAATGRNALRRGMDRAAEEARKKAEEQAKKEQHEAEQRRARQQREGEGARRNDEQRAAELKREREQKAEQVAADRRQALARHDQAIRRLVDPTDIEESAAAERAMMREEGGFTDDRGVFRRAGPDAQGRRLQQLIQRELKRRFPGMSAEDRQRTAAGIGMRTFTQVEGQLRDAQARAQAEAVAAGNDATQATLQAMRQVVARLRAEAMRARINDRNARQIQQGMNNGGWN